MIEPILQFKRLAKYLANKYVGDIDVEIYDVKRGLAYSRQLVSNRKLIVLPLWLLERKYVYRLSYILHEIAHLIYFDKGRCGHDKGFKVEERKLLIKYDLVPEYGRKYVKKLYNTQKQILWQIGD